MFKDENLYYNLDYLLRVLMGLTGERVTVTGGGSFFGGHIVKWFQTEGATVSVLRSKEYVLVNIISTNQMMENLEPEVMVHAPADVRASGTINCLPMTYFLRHGHEREHFASCKRTQRRITRDR